MLYKYTNKKSEKGEELELWYFILMGQKKLNKFMHLLLSRPKVILSTMKFDSAITCYIYKFEGNLDGKDYIY